MQFSTNFFLSSHVQYCPKMILGGRARACKMLSSNFEYFWGYSHTNFLFYNYILRFCPCDKKNANIVSNTFKSNLMAKITSLTQYLKYPHLHFIDSEMSETCRPIVFSFHRVLSLFLHTYWPRSVYNNYHCTCMFYLGVGQNHPGQNPPTLLLTPCIIVQCV